VFRELVVGEQRRRDDKDQRVTLAYEIAALTRGSKGLPPLKKLLSPPLEAERQTIEQLNTMMHALAERYSLRIGPTRLIQHA
jgi:hypothetical protein